MLFGIYCCKQGKLSRHLYFDDHFKSSLLSLLPMAGLYEFHYEIKDSEC